MDAHAYIQQLLDELLAALEEYEKASQDEAASFVKDKMRHKMYELLAEINSIAASADNEPT